MAIINGTASANTLNGQTGNDRIFGRAGGDVLNGNNGNDYLNGGADNDTLNGGTGNDRLFGLTGGDILYGNEGNDFLLADAIQSANDNPLLEAGLGNSNDALEGGLGNDTLVGGVGADRFYFYSPNQGIDVITDFNGLSDDRIWVSAKGFGIDIDAYDEISYNYNTDTLFIANNPIAIFTNNPSLALESVTLF